ncbi:MAG: hypothetical protein C5B58_10005 [Acidobacteria bacterium]|nr:MAG: hypothetical protein C5B58_10005 [Acidobacteriota bacterium]
MGGIHMEQVDDTSPKPHPLLRSIRKQAYLYSLICKSALFYSRNIAGAVQKKAFISHRDVFSMNAEEARHCNELRRTGLTVCRGLFDRESIDQIHQKADRLFRETRLNFEAGYSVQTKKRSTLAGLTYEQLEATEKVIYLESPLRNIPECVAIVFNESILRIVSNFLGYISPHFAAEIVRDFPHSRPKEASNFHKDFDDVDSVAAYIYLVDTTEQNSGAFVYVPYSNRYDPRSCRPRVSRDLGLNANDGRISDQEVEKHYPKDTWITVREKPGSVVIFHGNGIHKGPSWARYDDPRNRPRTAIRLGFGGFKLGAGLRRSGVKVEAEEYQTLSTLQRFFVETIQV